MDEIWLLDVFQKQDILINVDRLLQDKRVNPTIGLRSASRYGKIAVINRLLRDPRVMPNGGLTSKSSSEAGESKTGLNYITPLGYASEYGHLNVVNRLLEDPRINPSFGRNQALRRASKMGHLNVVNRLLDDPRMYLSRHNGILTVIGGAITSNHLDIAYRILSDPRIDLEDLHYIMETYPAEASRALVLLEINRR